jgi:ribonuclease HI
LAYKKHKQYRLFGFDYSKLGAYFVTINTKNRIHYFGEIENEVMHLSEIGRYVEDNFKKIEEKLAHLQVDEYQIMPDHIHLIITIIERNLASKPVMGLAPLNKKSISSFCNHLKGNITNWCTMSNFEFKWQARFHDRIIRNKDEYFRISEYIQRNVANWEKDKNDSKMAKKQKYYVVWKGNRPGIYDSWAEAEEQIKGVEGAKFKSYEIESEAIKAYSEKAEKHIYNKSNSNSKAIPNKKISSIISNSLSVDAACSGNPGVLEYQGVETDSKKSVFKMGPFPEGTVNLGEFLAIVHALALLKKHNSDLPIYSDSVTALAWVRNKKIKTNLERNGRNKELFDLVDRAIIWLNSNTYTNKVLKWETERWGENPADYGRK